MFCYSLALFFSRKLCHIYITVSFFLFYLGIAIIFMVLFYNLDYCFVGTKKPSMSIQFFFYLCDFMFVPSDQEFNVKRYKVSMNFPHLNYRVYKFQWLDGVLSVLTICSGVFLSVQVYFCQ